MLAHENHVAKTMELFVWFWMVAQAYSFDMTFAVDVHPVQALSYAEMVRAALEDYEIMMTGHSMGGTMSRILPEERSPKQSRDARLPIAHFHVEVCRMPGGD